MPSTLPPLAPGGGHAFTSGGWNGVCWKTEEIGSRFQRCDGRDLEPGSARTVVRTREGLDIRTTKPAYPALDDVLKFKLPASELSRDGKPTRPWAPG